jgi:CheY-like chemotaxis protein/anti-sigma regulatory factor (Ser/Thr protein kinase)
VARWAENAAQATERGTKLTGQLLTFSRRQRLEARNVDVGGLIAGMTELLRNSVGPTVDLKVEAAAEIGAVCSDPTQLELAILNLAINARDAMPSGGPLEVRAERRGDQIAITVVDCGVGMPPEVVERALEPFFTTKGPGRGTGLGLSMAYGVAVAAGGELMIDSKVGEGTVVTLLLPRVADASGTDAGRQADGAGRTSAEPSHILLVDDDPEVRSTLADMLRSHGHWVTEAANGPQALLELERSDVRLMLLDFAMPGMNGAEVAVQALELKPDIELLFLTGFSDSEAIDKAVNGRARVLKKPASAATLFAAIEDMLR